MNTTTEERLKAWAEKLRGMHSVRGRRNKQERTAQRATAVHVGGVGPVDALSGRLASSLSTLSAGRLQQSGAALHEVEAAYPIEVKLVSVSPSTGIGGRVAPNARLPFRTTNPAQRAEELR